MATGLDFSCRCGKLRGHLSPEATACATRVKCYCTDCQTGARALGAGHVLDANGGTDLIQTIPEGIDITEGADYLACLRISPNGLPRWYASCCDQPLFNTLAKPAMPFVGILCANLSPQEALRPVRATAHAGDAYGAGAPTRNKGFSTAVFAILSRALKARLRTGPVRAPFFTEDGALAVTPRVLTQDERAAAAKP